jgi:PPOX class probable F420-dependent enzyme
MTLIAESAHRLLSGPHTAVLSTVTPSGVVQSTAVWFLHDPDTDTIGISITDGRKKFRNLNANPNVTFFLLDPTNPWSYVEVRGTVTIAVDEDEALMNAIVGRHGEKSTGWTKPGETRQRVTITPVTVNSRIV